MSGSTELTEKRGCFVTPLPKKSQPQPTALTTAKRGGEVSEGRLRRSGGVPDAAAAALAAALAAAAG